MFCDEKGQYATREKKMFQIETLGTVVDTKLETPYNK